MKIALFGLGSIGKRYARLLMHGFPEHSLFAFRSGMGTENEMGIKELHLWEEVDRLKPDVALIANPTFLHIETAIKCARRGIHLFIEKPICGDAEGLSELRNLVKRRRLTAYVAYVLRFHPTLIELKMRLRGCTIYHANVRCSSFLPEWREGIDHMQTYSAYREKGGGAILELSHEFDYIGYLFNKIVKISGRAGTTGLVTDDAEDWADALVEHEGGNCTNLHVNFLSRKIQRNIEVDTDKGFFRVDLIDGTLEHTNVSGTETLQFKMERDQLYIEQLRYFFENISNPGLMNSLAEATHLFRKIIKFRQKAILL